jgi:SAM-dependent methyltransferase
MVDRGFQERNEFVAYVRAAQEIVPKDELITGLCRNRDVLDLGCIAHSYERAIKDGDKWLHKQIRRVARSLTGLDKLPVDAEKLNAEGYDIVIGDAENFALGRTFDVIVAGDLIEHLANIGAFLRCVENHMHDDSVCIISTPNPFNVEQAMKAIFENHIVVNREHTCWLDPCVMYETIARSGLRIADFYWVETVFKGPLVWSKYRHIINPFARYVMRRRPHCRRDYAVILRKSVGEEKKLAAAAAEGS